MSCERECKQLQARSVETQVSEIGESGSKIEASIEICISEVQIPSCEDKVLPEVLDSATFWNNFSDVDESLKTESQSNDRLDGHAIASKPGGIAQ